MTSTPPPRKSSLWVGMAASLAVIVVSFFALKWLAKSVAPPGDQILRALIQGLGGLLSAIPGLIAGLLTAQWWDRRP